MSVTRPDRDVMVCRDCCCGTPAKHPDLDHDAQVRTLQAAAEATAGRVRVRVVECLSECEESNVVLVRDLGARGRRRDTWLGGVLGPEATAAVAAWILRGGVLPPGLEQHRLSRVRR